MIRTTVSEIASAHKTFPGAARNLAIMLSSPTALLLPALLSFVLTAPPTLARSHIPCGPLPPLELAPRLPGTSIDLETSGLDLEQAMSRLSTPTLTTAGLAPLAARISDDSLVVLAKRCAGPRCELVLARFDRGALTATRSLGRLLEPDLTKASVGIVDFEGRGGESLLVTWHRGLPTAKTLQLQAFGADLAPLSPVISPHRGGHDRTLTLVPSCSARDQLEVRTPGRAAKRLPWPLESAP